MIIGDRFLLEDTEYKGYYNEYILALVDSQEKKINLINLSKGNPWTKPITVKDVNDITEEEFNRLTGRDWKFIRIRR